MKILAAILAAFLCCPAAGQTYFALQPANEQKRAVTESDLRLPLVSGVTIRLQKSWIYKSGVWNASFIEACRARCARTGDSYTLLVMGGPPNPLSESNLRWYETAAAWLGSRYAHDPLLDFVHVTGCQPEGAPSEFHWDKVTPQVETAAQRIIRAWQAAFPDKPLLWSCSGKDKAGQLRVIKYGLGRTEDFWVGNNALKQSTSLSANHNQIVVEAARLGAGMWFQMVGPAGNVDRFGPGGIKAGIAQGFRLADQAGYPRSELFFEVYPPDLAKLGG